MTLINSKAHIAAIGLALAAGTGLSVLPEPTRAETSVRSGAPHVDAPERRMAPNSVQLSPERAAWLRSRSTYRGWGYTRAGYSVRQGQRMAAKRRNQQRHRRAARG